MMMRKVQHFACMAFDLINDADDDTPKIRLLDKNPSFVATNHIGCNERHK